MALDAYFKGINFPFISGETSTPKQVTDADLVKQSIIRILLTARGERVNRPDFGSDFLAMIFEPSTDALSELIRVEVSTVISRYEPRAVLTNLKISRSDSTVIVELGFAVASTKAQQTIQMTFPVQ